MVKELGKFFVFEGPDGCGKSTAFLNVVRLLNEIELLDKFRIMREPGGELYLSIDNKLCPYPGQYQEDLREAFIKKREQKVSCQSEIQTFTSLRYQNGKDIIKPSVRSGINVLSDRYVISSMAYQGMRFGDETTPGKVLVQNIEFANLHVPDVIYYFRLSFEECLKRKGQTGSKDRIESEDLESKKRIFQGYLDAPEIFNKYYPEETEFVDVDASKSEEEIAKYILDDIIWRI